MSKPMHPKQNDQTNSKHNQTITQNPVDTTSSEAAGIVRGSLRTIRKTIENSPSRTRSATTTVTRNATKRIALSESTIIYPSFNKTPAASEPPAIHPSSYNKSSSLWKIFAIPKRRWKGIKGMPKNKPVVKASEHLLHDVTSKVLGQEEEGKIKLQDKESWRKIEYRRQQLAYWRNLARQAYFISACKLQSNGLVFLFLDIVFYMSIYTSKVSNVPKTLLILLLLLVALIKNTFIGIAVFETYEHVIDHFEKSTLENHYHGTTSTTITANVEEGLHNGAPKSSHFHKKNTNGTSLAQHFFAGTAAGSVHSILHLSFESISFLKLHRFRVNVYPTLPFLLSHGSRDIFHHGLSHALMFSTYEGMKRLLPSTLYNDQNTTYNIAVQKHGTVSFLNIVTIGVSGGVAGQVHHVASHVLESLLFVTEHRPKEQQGRSIRTISKNIIPSSRSIARSFLPSALGFIAFEFGKSLV
jgi:hypothetical protein